MRASINPPYLMANRFVQEEDGNSSRVDICEAGFTLADLCFFHGSIHSLRVDLALASAVGDACGRAPLFAAHAERLAVISVRNIIGTAKAVLSVSSLNNWNFNL